MKKSLSIFFIATILLQSCYVYDKTSVPITRATNNGRVKITNIHGQEFPMKEIILVDGVYFGKNHKKLIPINTPNEKQYYLLDITKTNSKTAIGITAAIVIPIGVLILIAVISIEQNGLGGSWM
jgi:hypothetical protein